MTARYSSNARIFERKGNPWVSRKEGEKDFGRNVETEDPEYDFDHRFHDTDRVGKPRQALARPDYRDAIPAPKEDDFGRRKANALLKMRSDMRGHTRSTHKVEAVRHVFKPCPGCRHALCAARMRCGYPLGNK